MSSHLAWSFWHPARSFCLRWNHICCQPRLWNCNVINFVSVDWGRSLYFYYHNKNCKIGCQPTSGNLWILQHDSSYEDWVEWFEENFHNNNLKITCQHMQKTDIGYVSWQLNLLLIGLHLNMVHITECHHEVNLICFLKICLIIFLCLGSTISIKQVSQNSWILWESFAVVSHDEGFFL